MTELLLFYCCWAPTDFGSFIAGHRTYLHISKDQSSQNNSTSSFTSLAVRPATERTVGLNYYFLAKGGASKVHQAKQNLDWPLVCAAWTSVSVVLAFITPSPLVKTFILLRGIPVIISSEQKRKQNAADNACYTG